MNETEKALRSILTTDEDQGHYGHHEFACNPCQRVAMIRGVLAGENVPGPICGASSPEGLPRCEKEQGHDGYHGREDVEWTAELCDQYPGNPWYDGRPLMPCIVRRGHDYSRNHRDVLGRGWN